MLKNRESIESSEAWPAPIKSKRLMFIVLMPIFMEISPKDIPYPTDWNGLITKFDPKVMP